MRWVRVLGACLCLLASEVRAGELDADLRFVGQVREGDLTRETESPVDFYPTVGLYDLPFGSSLMAFARAEYDFGTGDGTGDFYEGALHVPGVIPGARVIGGRQFLGEVPGGVYVADAGRVDIDPGWPVAFTLFGGVPRYFEPTFGSNIQSDDEVLFGGNVRASPLANSHLNLGYMQQNRGREVRQLVTAAYRQGLPDLVGAPSLYGSFIFDADRQNIDLVSLGGDGFFLGRSLLVNVESSYYKPQDQGKQVQTDIDRREDAIFEVFSVSQLIQARSGVRYFFTPSLSGYGDYSFQYYEQLSDENVDSHIFKAGLQWLPYGDGLETVGLEYVMINGDQENLQGARAQYQNDVYERLSFRVNFGFDYYEKISNEKDTAISSLVGLGYDILPNLFCEVNIEANSNQRFDEDVRFGFQLAYNFHSGGAGRQRVAPLGQTREAAFVPRRVAPGDQG